VASAATIGWIFLVHWRISRQPSVLWRAVVLSTGGGILCWLLWMTLWLPASNYAKSYAVVAQDIVQKLPADQACVDADVGPDQMASFSYFAHMKFSQFDSATCPYLLIQQNGHNKAAEARITNGGDQWQLIWEGRRPSDRDERFRLYKRIH
jgi:4-amino-4-deoxy-L-arabinose transferase-like glycosyltransferase